MEYRIGAEEWDNPYGMLRDRILAAELSAGISYATERARWNLRLGLRRDSIPVLLLN